MVYSLEAKRVIREIVRDMKRNIVSVDVGSFSELHDYVDANEYFIEYVLDGRYDGSDEENAKCNEVGNEVNAWFNSLPIPRRLDDVINAAPVI